MCSDWIIQHSLISFSDSGGVSGPSDSGSRSTSGDTGEGELREYYIPKYSDIPCIKQNLFHILYFTKREERLILSSSIINTALWPKIGVDANYGHKDVLSVFFQYYCGMSIVYQKH